MKITQNNNDKPKVGQSISMEIIQERLYYISCEFPPAEIHYFNIDDKIKYLKYYKDFGPACIANVANFCRVVRRYIFQDNTYQNKPLYFHSSNEREKQANTVFLISAFQVVVLNRQPEIVWEQIKKLDILPFRDASYNDDCNYQCTILDCLQAIKKATDLGWFKLDNFDIKMYEQMENQENGNISVIIPNKLLAFRGPLSEEYLEKQDKKMYYRISVDQLLLQLKNLKATTVIRCNSPEEYDRDKIINQGINHFDLYFPDGSCPTDDIIEQFINIVDSSEEYVGVHCKAGLGRTGTLIACYAIQKYNFTAREIIAWIRLCRSGSILGKQQVFLIQYEQKLIDQSLFKEKVVEISLRLENQNMNTSGHVLGDKQFNLKLDDSIIQNQQVNKKEKKSTKCNLGFWSCFSIFKKKEQVNTNKPKPVNKNMDIDFYREEPNQADILLNKENLNMKKTKENKTTLVQVQAK